MLQNDMDLYVTEDDNKDEMLRLYNKLEKDYLLMSENVDGLLEHYDAMLKNLG